METKTAKAVSLFKSGDVVSALKLFKTFRIGFSKEEKRTIQIAHESLTGSDAFYKQLMINTDAIRVQAIEIIKMKYNL
jgi:hypothetical protein